MNKRTIFSGLLILILLPILVVAALNKTKFLPRASTSLPIATVHINPGEIITKPLGEQIHLSTLAYDTSGNPITSGVSYQWGMSSTNSVGTIIGEKGNDALGTFTPSGNVGRGDLWVRAVTATSQGTGSIPVYVGVTPPTPTTAPIQVDLRINSIKKDNLKNELVVEVCNDGAAPITVPFTVAIAGPQTSDQWSFDTQGYGEQYCAKVALSCPVMGTTCYWPKITATADSKNIIPETNEANNSFDALLPIFNFSDVSSSSWSWKYIQQIVGLGIIPPRTSTTFAPANPILRSEMALYLSAIYKAIKGVDAPIVKTPFTDIATLTQDEKDAIARIWGLGLTAGTSDTTFSPALNVDRAQMAVFLVKLYRLITLIDPPNIPTPFTDLGDPAYAQNWVGKLYGIKITAGISATEYGPKLLVTREQMATFISNTFRAISSAVPPTPSVTPTPQPTLLPTPIATPSAIPTPTPTAKPTPSPIPTTTSTPTPTPVRFVTINSPNGGETLIVGQLYRITWKSSANIDKVIVSYVSASGTLGTITSIIPNTNFYDWVVNVGNTSNSQFKIDIMGYQTGVGSATDQSDNYFTIVKSVPIPTVTPTTNPTPTPTPSFIINTVTKPTNTVTSPTPTLTKPPIKPTSTPTIRTQPPVLRLPTPTPKPTFWQQILRFFRLVKI